MGVGRVEQAGNLAEFIAGMGDGCRDILLSLAGERLGGDGG